MLVNAHALPPMPSPEVRALRSRRLLVALSRHWREFSDAGSEGYIARGDPNVGCCTSRTFQTFAGSFRHRETAMLPWCSMRGTQCTRETVLGPWTNLMNSVASLSILDTPRCGLAGPMRFRPIQIRKTKNARQRFGKAPRSLLDGSSPRGSAPSLSTRCVRTRRPDPDHQEGRDPGRSERGPPDPAPSTSPSGLKNTLYQRSAYASSSRATRSRVSSK